jgi:hypothetical protein
MGGHPGEVGLVDRVGPTDSAPERRISMEIRVSPAVARMLRVAAAEQTSRIGGRPSVSVLVSELIQRHWAELGGPLPPFAPDPPPAMVLRGEPGDASDA